MTGIGYIVIIAVMLIWIMQNRKKERAKAEQLKESFRPGMYVRLTDGLFGTIVDLNDRDAVINLSTEGRDEGCITIAKENIYAVIESAAGASEGNGAAIPAGAGTEHLSIEERVKRAEAFNAGNDQDEDDRDGDEGTTEAEGSSDTEAAKE